MFYVRKFPNLILKSKNLCFATATMPGGQFPTAAATLLEWNPSDCNGKLLWPAPLTIAIVRRLATRLLGWWAGGFVKAK